MKKFSICVFSICLLAFALAGASAAAPSRDEMLQIIKSDDVTALDAALADGLDVNTKLDDNDITLLHFAILSNSHGVIRELVDAGADIEAESSAGTPLYMALMFSRTDTDAPRRESKGEIIDLLLEKGANVNALSEWGDSPLNLATSGINVQFCLDMARKLIERGAKINTRTDFGLTPLHDAFTVFVANDPPNPHPHPDSLASRAPLVAFLIASGADVNARTMDGETPLFYALQDVESMKLLLDAGAKTDVKNKNDETPFDIATREGYDDAVKLLIMRIGN